MSKVCVIKQPAGIGDILYCSKIAYHYRDLGYEIVWPVSPANMYLNDYSKDLEFVDSTTDFNHKDIYTNNVAGKVENDKYLYLPLYLAVNYLRLPSSFIMSAKYRVSKVDGGDWYNYMKIERNLAKEYALFKKLGLSEGEEYALVNRNYYPWEGYHQTIAATGDFPATKDKVGNFRIKTNIKIVNMSRVDGYTVLDWMLVLGCATEVWTMDTCIILLMEVINLKEGVKLNMFVRGRTVKSVDHLCSKPWNFKLLQWSM